LSIIARVVGLLRRHFWLLPVLAAGITLRVLMVIAYPHAFFFPDSRPYVFGASDSVPDPARPYGYSFLLKPFVHPYAEYEPIALIQHLIGLALIVAGYAFLVRRGLPRWGAALAVLPVAIDARQLTIEQYVLAETAYIALTAAALMLLAWRDRVGVIAAAVAGLLLACAAVTRTVGLPVLGLAGLYLLVRRAGWARLGAFVLPVALVLGGYLAWYHSNHGVYAFGQYQGRFLYGRVMSYANCAELKLTPEQRTLCMPDAPPTWKQKPDQYIWNHKSPARRLYPDPSADPFLGDFAKSVIKQEPGQYLAMVVEGTSWHLVFKAPLDSVAECYSAGRWIPPAQPGKPCQAPYYLPTADAHQWTPPSPNTPNPMAQKLAAYGGWATTPGPLYALGVVLALIAAVWRCRRPGWRVAADALLFVGTGFGLLVVSVATSIFDYRYSIPAVLFIPLGIALALHRIVAVSRRVPAAAEPEAALSESLA
jgi:hypothetical protein